MTEIERELQTKSSREEDKDYSMKCTQNVCIIKYKGKIKYRGTFKWVPLVNRFGETAVQIFGILEIILGIIGTIIVYIALGEISGDIDGVKEYLLAIFIIFGSVAFAVLFLDGIFSQSSAKFLKFLKCKKCGRKNAYEEREDPDVREDSAENFCAISITRYWKCKYCGYLDSSESSENIKCFKGKKKKPLEITCEKCGKTSLSPEYRNPDLKKEYFSGGYIATEIRYYRCKYCGHVNIQVKKNDINYVEPLASSEIEGKDPRL